MQSGPLQGLKGQRALIGAGGDAGVAGGATGSDTTALGCDFERDWECGSESGSSNVTFFSEASRSCKHWNELESGMDEGGNEVGGQAGKSLNGSEGSGESKSGEISLAVKMMVKFNNTSKRERKERGERGR